MLEADRYELIMIESICNRQEVIAENIVKVKVNGNDYLHIPMEQAIADFKCRITKYEQAYEPLSQHEGFPYIKTINVGEGIEVYRINGYLQEKIMTYTMNLTISPHRLIYLSRHGESEYNTQERIGGNSSLTPRGAQYAKALPTALNELITSERERENVTILTSTMNRTIETAKYIRINDKQPIELRVLDEINAGICEHLTYKEVLEQHPEVYKQR